MAMTPNEAEPKSTQHWGFDDERYQLRLRRWLLRDGEPVIDEKPAIAALIADANLGARMREVWRRVDERFAERAEALYMDTGDEP
jgi:hypothetical protein